MITLITFITFIASRYALDAIIKTYNIKIFTNWKNYLKASGTVGIDAATQGRLSLIGFFSRSCQQN